MDCLIISEGERKAQFAGQLLVSRVIGQVPYQDSTSPVSAFIRTWAITSE